MEKFSLESNVANLINEFNELSLKGSSSVLGWFYEAIKYKGIFESSFGTTVFNTLKNAGYTEVTSTKDELENFKVLMQSNPTDNEEKVGYTLISLILKSIKETNSISPYLEQLIAVYNQNYNKDKVFKNMMDLLSSSVGNYVVFVIIRDASVKLASGKLEGVIPYQKVIIDGVEYPFIGYNIEINKITSNDGKELFSNILSSPKDDLTDYNVIAKKNRCLFGDNYKENNRLL